MPRQAEQSDSLPLFEEEDGPQHVAAPDVEAIAKELLDKNPVLGHFADEIDAGAVRLAYLFDTKEFDPDKEELKPHVLAQAMKAPAVWRTLSGFDGAIVVREWFWTKFDDRQRHAVVLHELLHFTFNQKGQLKMRSHDIEEFGGVLAEYGSWTDDRRIIYKLWNRWQQKQDLPDADS